MTSSRSHALARLPVHLTLIDLRNFHLFQPLVYQVATGALSPWITWLTVHLWYLIGFENRVLVLPRWAFSFIAHGRGARVIAAA